MKKSNLVGLIALLAPLLLNEPAMSVTPEDTRASAIELVTDQALDGAGGQLHNARILVKEGKIRLRAMVRKRKAQGADLIKIFASSSQRVGAKPTLTEEQLRALCGEPPR